MPHVAGGRNADQLTISRRTHFKLDETLNIHTKTHEVREWYRIVEPLIIRLAICYTKKHWLATMMRGK